jgi:xanthine dehydrogenase molybdenum-binding subunit
MTHEFSVLGKNLPRKDAVEKVNGQVTFVSDIHLPNMLHAKFLKSPYAHARIKRVDTSKAERMPGVRCILTHRDVPKVHPQRKLEYLLDETVHRPGEEIAAVAALTAEIATEAIKLIEVDYEVLPAIIDFEEALKPGAPLAHQDYGTNIYHGSEVVRIARLDEDGWLRLEVGNLEEGLSRADHVLEGAYEAPMQYNCSPLPRAVLCEWTGETLTCWADTQVPYNVWRDLAKCLEIPLSDVRVIARTVGSYGGKNPGKIGILAAIMAKRTGRPVKAVFSRSEDMIGTHHRVQYKTSHKVGVKKDGTITGMYSRILANYGSDTHVPYVNQGTALTCCAMLYRCENSKAETCGVLTNFNGHGSMNGFGDPEIIYCLERIMDEAAEKIDMDPVAFRLKNCMRYGDRAMEYEQVLDGPIDWGILGPDLDSFPELIKRCAEKAQWKEKWKGWRTPMAVDGYRRRGIGMAIGMHHTAFWPCSAIVRMNHDGSATVLSGAVEIGQGYATAICQVVAETLGIGYDKVSARLSDSAFTPPARGNIASTGTSSAINAAKIAAEDAKRKIFESAAPRLNASTDDLETKDGRIVVKGSSNSLPIADVCFTNWQITGTGNNPPYHAIRDDKTGKVIHAYAAAATIVEVEVDTGTGRVDLIRITSGHDTGRSINPIVVENQIDLGLVMAGGWVLSEEYRIDPETGIIINPNLLDYKLSTFLDIPDSRHVQKTVEERPCAWGPFGAKGFSETAMTALGPAIANAIYNATGTRVHGGSMSPENLLREMQKN